MLKAESSRRIVQLWRRDTEIEQNPINCRDACPGEVALQFPMVSTEQQNLLPKSNQPLFTEINGPDVSI